jgi:hypothetical protein
VQSRTRIMSGICYALVNAEKNYQCPRILSAGSVWMVISQLTLEYRPGEDG